MQKSALFLLPFLATPSLASAVEFETVMIEMRDGTQLATDVFYPSEGGPVPTLMVRTPYGRDFVPLDVAEVICDQMGYAIVTQDTRGRGDSQGVDDVFLSDGWGDNQDGFDTIEWNVNQPWSDGSVGMLGASAFGITAYLAAGSFHPALKAVHIGIAPTEFYEQAVYQGGVFREALVVDWLNGQDSSHMLELYEDHPQYDDTWASLDLRTRWSGMTPAITHWGGFYDIFAEGPLAGFAALQKGGPDGMAGPQKLVMGPWTHVDLGAWARKQGELQYPSNSLLPIGELAPFAFFDRFLKDEGRGGADRPDPFPVRYYLMGDVDNAQSPANQWHRAKEWPLPATDVKLYLKESGALEKVAPQIPQTPLTFASDPANPLPTIGGRELSLPAGPRDQSPLLERDDVLVFETDVLDEALTVVGNIQANLWVSSSAEDTDISVRLMDVYPDGRAMLVTDGMLKARYRNGFTGSQFLTPGDIVMMTVDVGSTALMFEPGHKLQIIISSTNHNRFKIGHNTTAGIWDDITPVSVANTIYVDDVFASHLVLPVPHANVIERAEMKADPSPAARQNALKRAQEKRPLTAKQYEALRFHADTLLMETIMGHVNTH